jgi:hypothetical protein
VNGTLRGKIVGKEAKNERNWRKPFFYKEKFAELKKVLSLQSELRKTEY